MVMGAVVLAVSPLIPAESCVRLPKNESRLILCRAVLLCDLLLLLLLLSCLLQVLGRVVAMDFDSAGTNADTDSRVVAATRSSATVRG
jgi:hypothetical protein